MCAVLLALLALASAPRGPRASTAGAQATVLFGGDVIPHRALLAAMQVHGPELLFARLTPLLARSDLALVNLDSPAAPSHAVPAPGALFNAPPALLHALARAGFDGVSVANNHAYDAGEDGIVETLASMHAAGLTPMGGAAPRADPFAPTRFVLAPGTLCVIAASRLTNDARPTPDALQPRVALVRWSRAGEPATLLRAVRRARASCDVVLVSLHMGAEFSEAPDEGDRLYVRQVALAGADVIVAHHTHTVQPIEVLALGARSVPVFYGLGTVLSGHGALARPGGSARLHGRYVRDRDPRVREGLLAVLRFTGTSEGALALERFGFVPLWVTNTSLGAPAGSAPVIAAGPMPEDGDGDPLLAARYHALVRRVGDPYRVRVDDGGRLQF